MAFSSKPLPADVVDALQRGNTIGAIKLLRASTGLGLKEAKDDGGPPADSGPAPREVPRTGGFSWWLVAAGIAAVAGYYLLHSPG